MDINKPVLVVVYKTKKKTRYTIYLYYFVMVGLQMHEV